MSVSWSRPGADSTADVILRRATGTGSFLYADPAVEQNAHTEAAHTSEQKALTVLRGHQSRNGRPGD
jgi:hypothetical protein